MLYCSHCNLRIDGAHSYCPLCENSLQGTSEESLQPYPQIEEKRSHFSFLLKLLSIIAFFSIVSCLAVDFIVSKANLSWSIFAACGIASLWLSTVVAISKRSKLLKNILFQFIIMSSLAFLWDFFTGKHGFAVDYVYPCLCIGGLISVFVLSRIIKQSAKDDVFYLMLFSVFGLIPLLFLLQNLVHVLIPSVICIGFSINTLLYIFIFRRKLISKELLKRFHL